MDYEISYMKFTPAVKSWNKILSYCTFSGKCLIFNTAVVIIPKVPSDPKINSLRSGPELTLGTSYFLS